MSVQEAATFLNISVGRVYRAVRDGDLPAHDVKGKLLIRRVDVKRYARRRDAWLRLHGRAAAG